MTNIPMSFRFPCRTLGIIALALGCGTAESDLGQTKPIETLNFGLISTESSIGLRRGFQPFIDDMSKSIGMPVKAFYASDYAGIIEAMRFDKVHVAWFGNKSAVEAVDRAGAEVFAQTVAADGSPGYWSLVLVHRDSPYRSVDDLIASGKELTFGNGDPHSTSGYLIPGYHLWDDRGIDPRTYFKRTVNSNHESNALAVAAKQVDFATCNTETYSKMTELKPDVAEKLRIVWKSPLIRDDPLVWKANLPDELKQRIRKFVFAYGREGSRTEREREILKGLSAGWAFFRESNNDHLVPIREIMVAHKLKDLEADRAATDPQEQKKIDELRARLKQLREKREAMERQSDRDSTRGAA